MKCPSPHLRRWPRTSHLWLHDVLAGGGIKVGLIHGATDDFGWHPIKDKVHVRDLHATILHQLGFDHERLTFRYCGRDHRLTDLHGHVVKEILE